MGEARRVDESHREIELWTFKPIFLEHATLVFIMRQAWSERNNAKLPLDFKNKEAKHTSFNANGTGPFMLVARQPDIRTTFKRNPNWWGAVEGNVREVIYFPIKNEATRTSALVAAVIGTPLDTAPPRI